MNKPNPFFQTRRRAARALAVLLALLVWEVSALLLHNALLLPSPVRVVVRLGEMLGEGLFWRSLAFSFTHIVGGFLLAFAAGVLLAAAASRAEWFATLLWPYVAAAKTVPVASFIILALVWLRPAALSLFISFLMVFPVIYTNALQGFSAAGRDMQELAAVFRVPLWRRMRFIYLPALRPYLTAACSVALGMCWKAGVAAEVIGVVTQSVGGRLYDAKIYLEITDLFAWTVVIVLLSVLFEKLFSRLLRLCFRCLGVK